MLRTVYHVVSVVALANLVAITGMVAFLFSTGRLNTERIEQIASVLRGEYPTEEGAEVVATTQPADKQSAETRITQAKEETDLSRRLLERRFRELEDRRLLGESMLLDIVRRQEALDAERLAFQEQQQKIRAERLQSGFVKELELLASVKPKVRKDLLRSKSDADVVKLMMELDERAGKQVIEACKTPEEKAWIGRILHQIQTLNEIQTADAGANEQEAP